MSIRIHASLITVPALALLSLIGGGCKSTPTMGQYDVRVTLDPSMRRADGTFPTVEVDLVGVNPDADAARWNQKSMTEYFAPEDPMRNTANKYSMVFRYGKNAMQTMPKNDKIWKTWKSSGVMSMYVLAFLPGVHQDKEGAADDRRLIVPLDEHRWNVSTLRLNLKASGITLLDQPKP